MGLDDSGCYQLDGESCGMPGTYSKMDLRYENMLKVIFNFSSYQFAFVVWVQLVNTLE